MKKIFITGIAGFIGYHLALFLKQRGDFVIGCDNFNSYYDPALKRERQKLLQNQNITVLDCDIRQTASFEKILVEQEITHFVHLAAQAGVRYSLTNPESYIASNLDGFVQIIEMIRRHPHIKFTYASSSSVYGLNQKIPFSEKDPTDQPASFYGATKKSNELIAHSYHHLYKIAVTGLRFFTVYGPFGRPDMAYYSFTKAILSDEPISIYNKGQILMISSKAPLPPSTKNLPAKSST
jgi:UDP-glucuronate 4-epimerase